MIPSPDDELETGGEVTVLFRSSRGQRRFERNDILWCTEKKLKSIAVHIQEVHCRLGFPELLRRKVEK